MVHGIYMLHWHLLPACKDVCLYPIIILDTVQNLCYTILYICLYSARIHKFYSLLVFFSNTAAYSPEIRHYCYTILYMYAYSAEIHKLYQLSYPFPILMRILQKYATIVI